MVALRNDAGSMAVAPRFWALKGSKDALRAEAGPRAHSVVASSSNLDARTVADRRWRTIAERIAADRRNPELIREAWQTIVALMSETPLTAIEDRVLVERAAEKLNRVTIAADSKLDVNAAHAAGTVFQHLEAFLFRVLDVIPGGLAHVSAMLADIVRVANDTNHPMVQLIIRAQVLSLALDELLLSDFTGDLSDLAYDASSDWMRIAVLLRGTPFEFISRLAPTEHERVSILRRLADAEAESPGLAMALADSRVQNFR